MRKLILLLSVVLSMALVCALAQAEGTADEALLTLGLAGHPLSADYEPSTLSPISVAVEGVNLVTTRTALLQEVALEPLYQMMRAAANDGQTLYVRQAYRSYTDEERRYALLSGSGQAAQKPGESSYQTGLSVTLVGADWKTKELTEDFADSSEAKWLSAHAAEYGFVLRYPKGKESFTGWSYEPWHYRYVGVAAASTMAAEGLSLEELAGQSPNDVFLVEDEDSEPAFEPEDEDGWDEEAWAEGEEEEEGWDEPVWDQPVQQPVSVDVGDSSLLTLGLAGHPLSADYEPNTLSPISAAVEGVNLVTTRTSLLQEVALEPLYRMMRAAASDGQTLYVRQAYRSYTDEERRYALLSGSGQAAQKPGASSYQTGLSVTLVGADWKTKELTEDFADSSEAQWLSAHAAEFGFVLRYPKGKESVTGWSYEPWHYRYVGVAAASAMTEEGLCLEELVQNSDLVSALPQNIALPDDVYAVDESEPNSAFEADDGWDDDEPTTQSTKKHSVPEVRDPSTIDPADIGPDGDYEISLGDLS